MEKEINVAEILKDKPKGTKSYETKTIKYQKQISSFVLAIDKKELLPIVLQRQTKWILGKL